MLFVSLLCLVTVAGAQTSDGPYILYQEDGTVRMVSVTPEGRLVDTLLASLPGDYGFTVVSSDQEHRFDVSLHPVERPDWKTEQPDRIFVTSDPHGNLDCFISLLQGNGVIDADCHWSFGTDQLVVIGDVFDRGNDAVQILWLIYQLEAEAAKAGGRVDYLLGNHEPMVLMNDLRYARPKYTGLADTLGMKYADLLSPSSELGRWLSVRNTMQVSGRCLFVHAGLSSDFYRQNLDIPFVNEQVSAGLYKTKAERKEASPMIYFLMGSSGPLWYRGMVRDAEKTIPCPRIPSAFHTGRCRVKRPFSTTFSFSLCVNPHQSRLSLALLRFPTRKVPTDVAFHRHLVPNIRAVVLHPVSRSAAVMDAMVVSINMFGVAWNPVDFCGLKSFVIIKR